MAAQRGRWPRRFVATAALLAAWACVTVPPRPQPPPQLVWSLDALVMAPGGAVAGALVAIQDGPNAGVSALTDAAGRARFDRLVQSGFTVCAEAAGFVRNCEGVTLTAPRDVLIVLAVDPADTGGALPELTPEQLRTWRGTITMPVDGLPTFGLAWPLLFTAQGYDSTYTDAERALARAAFKADGYTHWPYGPLLQRGYHGQWPSTDFRGDPSQFLARARELRLAGIIPVLFLLDDYCEYACENGEVKRDAIERDLTPLYSQPEWQQLFPIVVAGWEPRWSAADWQWVVQWMARVWPDALRAIHFPSGMGAPGLHSDLASEGGPYPNEASLWNGVIPSIHVFLMQETWVFTGDEVDAGRTREQQFEYDLLDKHRRFTYGNGGNAPHDGPAVDRWEATRGTDGKPYWQWDGTYSRASADGTPVDVVAFEYASYVLKTKGPSVYPEQRSWGAIALTVTGLLGFGDGGPR